VAITINVCFVMMFFDKSNQLFEAVTEMMH